MADDAAFTRRPAALLPGSSRGFVRRSPARLAGQALASARRHPARHDLYAGPCRISGTVSVLADPASRPVLLLPQDDIKAVRATRSAADGSYSFEQVAAGEWIVLGLDDTGAYRAVAVDRVTTVAP